MSSAGQDFQPGRLWSLWDMLQSYYPIYQLALMLQSLRTTALFFKDSVHKKPPQDGVNRFNALLEAVHQRCLEYGLNYTSDMAKRIIDKPALETYADIFPELDHLNGSLSYELEKEAVFRVPPERKKCYEQNDLFGKKVAAAFPSCERDIRKAGSCYALGQEDACVHHLMLVLERGLNALAVKVGVPYQRTNWQNIIDPIATKLKLAPRGTERDFYIEVNAQFGFLKDAYRNHSEHARDNPYDMDKARSILNHVRDFMQALEKGGLSEQKTGHWT
jgi:hypothetical protein